MNTIEYWVGFWTGFLAAIAFTLLVKLFFELKASEEKDSAIELTIELEDKEIKALADSIDHQMNLFSAKNSFDRDSKLLIEALGNSILSKVLIMLKQKKPSNSRSMPLPPPDPKLREKM